MNFVTALTHLERTYLERASAHAQQLGQKTILDRQHAQRVLELTQLQSNLEIYRKVHELLVTASTTARALVKEKIEHLVTLALCAIMDEPYRFRVDLTQSAVGASATFWVINPEGLELDPIENSGGGIADICSLALRLAVLEMYEPVVEGPILLDENFKYLSREHARRVIEFLQTIISRTHRQILLVTHVPELAAGADRAFEVLPIGATSTIMDITSAELSR